jgi:serine/threonine protein kinase
MIRGPGIVSVRPLRPGRIVGGYEVIAPLVAGGMGQLYQVTDIALGRDAVLKVLHDKHATRVDLAARLREEARVLAHLDGIGVPDIYAMGDLDEQRPYFVMERLRGRDLQAELSRLGVMSVPTSVRLVLDLLATLEAVHQRSVVHRDIKLDNLFLRESGRLSLLDFGVARRTDEPLDLTQTGMTMGTLRNMAPEQHLGADIDERTDLYAAGLVLFELMTGRGPFDHLGVSQSARRAAHCAVSPPPPSSLAPQHVPKPIEEVVLRSLSKRREDRYRSAASLARALVEASESAHGNDEGPTFVDPSLWFMGRWDAA